MSAANRGPTGLGGPRPTDHPYALQGRTHQPPSVSEACERSEPEIEGVAPASNLPDCPSPFFQRAALSSRGNRQHSRRGGDQVGYGCYPGSVVVQWRSAPSHVFRRRALMGSMVC